MAEVAPDDPRVKLAEGRAVLAAERTFAPWLRTGLSFLGGGLVAQRFLREALSVWPLKLLSVALIACALGSFAAAAWRDRTTRIRLAHAEVASGPDGCARA